MSDYDWMSFEPQDGQIAAVADLPRDLAAISRVLLGIPARTGARARVVEESVAAPAPEPAPVVPVEAVAPVVPVAPVPLAPLEGGWMSFDPVAAAQSTEAVELPEDAGFAAPTAIELPDFEGFAVPGALPEVEPLVPVQPLMEVEPLVEVQPLVEVAPLVPTVTAGSWDQLGAAVPVEPVVEPVVEDDVPAGMDGRSAANVLAELSFLDA